MFSVNVKEIIDKKRKFVEELSKATELVGWKLSYSAKVITEKTGDYIGDEKVIAETKYMSEGKEKTSTVIINICGDSELCIMLDVAKKLLK